MAEPQNGLVELPAEEKPPAALPPFVKFAPENVHRKEIKSHPFNPRSIKQQNRDRLKAAIKKVGLLEPLVWNRRSGHLVGGHQRLGILDQLMRTEDYLVPVAVVDLDEAEEKAQLVALNNSSLQGSWDMARMEDLVKHQSLDLDAAGLDAGEVAEAFGLDSLGSEKLQTLAEQLKDAKARHDKIKESLAGVNDADFYRVFVFRDRGRAGELSKWMGEQSPVRFLDGEALMAKVTGGS